LLTPFGFAQDKLAGSAMEKSLTQGFRVNRAGAGIGVLAKAFQRGLAGFGMHLTVINHFNPGQQGLIEFAQGGDVGTCHFGQSLS
jgi:hypothetical protein